MQSYQVKALIIFGRELPSAESRKAFERYPILSKFLSQRRVIRTQHPGRDNPAIKPRGQRIRMKGKQSCAHFALRDANAVTVAVAPIVRPESRSAQRSRACRFSCE